MQDIIIQDIIAIMIRLIAEGAVVEMAVVVEIVAVAVEGIESRRTLFFVAKNRNRDNDIIVTFKTRFASIYQRG